MSIPATLYQLAALIDASDINVPKPNGGSDTGLLRDVLLPVYFWAAVVAVIVIVVAGFMYTTSSGDAAKLTRAKNAILSSVIGLVVVLLAFGITSIVITGVKWDVAQRCSGLFHDCRIDRRYICSLSSHGYRSI